MIGDKNGGLVTFRPLCRQAQGLAKQIDGTRERWKITLSSTIDH